MLNGDAEAVDALLTHPDVHAISFVGSTPVARHVYETGTAHGKRVQALGGAKNHMVVVPDADLDVAADAAINAAYGSAGERCMAISVVVAVEPVADALVEAIASRIPDVVVGPGDEADSMMGPLVTAQHRDRVRSYVDGAAGEGAVVVVDGPGRAGSDGFFVGCTLLDRVAPGMRVYDDEIFGPVLSVVRVASLDEAIALVNANPYGNGVALFTARWRRGAPVRARDRGRHGRHQRADPGPGRVVLVRWVEGVDLRRQRDVRPRGGSLLHPAEGRHHPLARAARRRDRPRVPRHVVTSGCWRRQRCTGRDPDRDLTTSIQVDVIVPA